MIIEICPDERGFYLVDIDIFEETILLCSCMAIKNEDMLLRSISLFKKLAGQLENYHIVKRKGDKALIFLLNNVGEVMAQGMHLQTEAEYIVKKIVKNYEKIS